MPFAIAFGTVGNAANVFSQQTKKWPEENGDSWRHADADPRSVTGWQSSSFMKVASLKSLRRNSRRNMAKYARSLSTRSTRAGFYDDYEFDREGPLDPVRPKFIKEGFQTSAEDPSVVPGVGVGNPNRKRGRKFKRATPAQALAGSLIAGICCYFLVKGTSNVYYFIEAHPLVKSAPFGLNSHVNDLILSMVVGFGAIAIGMFGVSAVGLLLLSIENSKLQPPQT